MARLKALGRDANDALYDAIWEDNPRTVILRSACITFYLGVFLLLPMQTIAATRTYAFMQAVPEPVWGLIFCTVGAMKFVTCLVNGALRRSSWARYLPVALQVAVFVLWSLFYAGIVLSNPNTFGTVMYLFMVFDPVWCGWRRWRQARGYA